MNYPVITSFLLIFCIGISVSSYAVETTGAATHKALIVQGLDGNSNLCSELTKEIGKAGYSVDTGDFDALLAPDPGYDLIVLSDASALPIDAFDRFHQHFGKSGDIIALKTPMWKSQLIRKDGRWVDRDEYLTQSAFNYPGSILLDFDTAKPENWQRETGKADVVCTWKTEKDPTSGRMALRVNMDDLQGFEFLSSPDISNAFPGDNTLTILTAKGSEHTTQIAVRWEEKDGSRWIAVIPVSGKWRQYILRPSDFKWNGGESSRQNTSFNPKNASRIAFGLSWGDTGQIAGKYEYWIDGVSTDVDSDEYKNLYGGNIIPPDFETLSPAYKLFDMSGVKKLSSHPGQSIINVGNLPVPSSLMSPHQRPQGNGFAKERGWRWIPLLQGSTSSGEWRGTPASLMVYTSGGAAGSAFGSFGVQDKNWYKDPASIKLIGDTARRIKNGVFIIDGGADSYTYTAKQPVRLGLTAANIGKFGGRKLKAVVSVLDPVSGKTAIEKSWQIDLPASAEKIVEYKWIPATWSAKGYKVSAKLYENGILLDRVQHDINLWKPKSVKSFVTIKDGEFILNGKPWRANGINYHPSSTVATWDWGLFLEWFGKRSYDPEVIERDLSHMNDMGINAVSIQVCYGKPPKTDNLLDFLRRLDAHGIKANLALPLSPMTDLDTRWSVYRDVINQFNLKDIDTIFAYDIDWEPTWLTTDYRKQWDKEWANWVVERYGSIENAESDWGVPISRNPDGSITNPPVPQIQSDGEWRRMSAAYRRFLGTLLYRQYSTAKRMINELDPNHAVSFRMHAAGDGGSGWYGLLPYDWSYLAAAVDIFSPEAYSLGKSWDTGVKRGLFTSAYAKWANPNNPIIYAETGFNLLEYPGELSPRGNAMDRQFIFYNDFYKMIKEGSIDGVFWWWFPGGFRCMENSDYGVINPDGSDRPVSALIRNTSKVFNKALSLKPGKRFVVDPEAFISSSEAGSIYDQIKDDFWTEIDKGAMPVIDSPRRGTDSSNCPMVAVGNTPCNGKNPPKYLDALFDTVEVQLADGKWQMVKKGEEITVDNTKPVKVRMKVTNLGYAEWLSGDRTGSVTVEVSGDIADRISLRANLPHLKSADIGPYVIQPDTSRQRRTITLRMNALGRTPFGDMFTFTLTK